MMKINLSQAIRSGSPATVYRIGNSTLRFQMKYIFVIGLIFLLCLVYVLLPTWSDSSEIDDDPIHRAPSSIGGKRGSLLWASKKDTTYPRTTPVQTEKGLKYRFGIIADLDTDSKTPLGKWISYFRRGSLYVQFNSKEPNLSRINIEWDSGEPQMIKSGLNLDGRGMELSELFAFDNHILTCDDRTGIVYSLDVDSADDLEPVPWVILADGNGTVAKGFKCEWGCVKERQLWIGGLGKEWTTPSGELVNHNPQFVKRVAAGGLVSHLDWKTNYNAMAHALGIHFPGYVIHESGGWSDILERWMFLPRRASKDQYNEKTDEKMGTNVILLADEGFKNIEVRHVGEIIPSHGFSSFKWIPGTDDKLVLGLKSEEADGKTATYVMVFTIDGHIIIPETKVGDHKYEGIEFI